jgi:serine/threonine protein kinase
MLNDSIVAHLRAVADLPDLTGTRYELVEPIGRGGMGTVYRVRDMALGREVALKVLGDVPEPAAGALVDRLRREAAVLAALEHPGIVPVHDVGVLPDGRPFYVMKLVRGARLDEHVAALTTVPDRLRVLERIAEAVAFAHAQGIIHRDLTPANVMMGPFGEVLVMDWGVARVGQRPGDESAADSLANLVAASSSPHTANGTIVGTPGFMSPEQARGAVDQVDERSDVYALGALLAWLLAPARGGPVLMPAPLRSIRDRARAESPGERYPSAMAFAEDLSRFRAGLPVAAHVETVGERVTRFARTYRVPILLVLAYLVMRLALLAFRGL